MGWRKALRLKGAGPQLPHRDPPGAAAIATPAKSAAPDAAGLSFEAALRELETIVGRLEQGEVDLEDSIALYERGQALKAHCEAKLKSAEGRLEKIVLGASGPEGVVPADAHEPQDQQDPGREMSIPNTKTPLLDQVDLPADLRKLDKSQLRQFADELRTDLIDTVSMTGGHFGSSLGVVELTTALHYVFNTPADRVIWDVGHQAYPHKIITGRRSRMRTLRTGGGLSGFTKRSESEYDPFGAAHSSTSISGEAWAWRRRATSRAAGTTSSP